MTDVTLIEIQDQAAGIVTRDGRTYRFHAAARDFHPIDGQVFDSVLAAERAARRLIAGPARQHRGRSAQTDSRQRRRPATPARTRRVPARPEVAFAD